MWYSCILGLYIVAFVIGSDLIEFDNNCGNCTVSSGLGYNSFPGDCTCYWVCTLRQSYKVARNTGNGWMSYKRCCPCDMTWSQKLLTCVSFRNKQSDCVQGRPSQNLCNGVAAYTILPRTDPDSVAVDSLCSGYTVCLQVGDLILPRAQCCPDGQCFDTNGTASMPCSTEACTSECEGVDDCNCTPEPAKEKEECTFQAMPDDDTKFMRRWEMHVYSCPRGTCWSQEHCTCVHDGNVAYTDCIPWLQMDFDDGKIEAVSGQNHFMWSEFSGTTLESTGDFNTSFYARFDGSGDYINLASLANAYFGNVLVLRFLFKLENNGGAPEQDELQTIVTNCFDRSGNGFVDPTIDVCLFRRRRTGTGTQMSTKVTFNKGWFMIDGSMRTAVINLFTTLSVDVWYEYWLLFLGNHGLLYNAVLNENGTVLAAKTYPVEGSKFIVMSKSGFVFGTTLQSFKRDYNGGIDEILLYRCKPTGDPDFDSDFDAIEDFVGKP